MDTVLKNFLWKKNLTAPNSKIFYIYGGAILVFKGIFFQHLNQNICPPVVSTHCTVQKINKQINGITPRVTSPGLEIQGSVEDQGRLIVLDFYFFFKRRYEMPQEHITLIRDSPYVPRTLQMQIQ